MNNMLKQFLKECAVNKKLDQMSFELLYNNFENYVFKIKFLNYLNKVISFSAQEFRFNYYEYKNKELLLLNEMDDNYEEERINLLADKGNNIDDESFTKPKNTDFSNIVTDIRILNAVNNLSEKQKEVLYKIIILGLTEKELSNALGVSQQAINKIKNKALNELRAKLREVC